MELQIKDRLFIPALFPKEGNFRQFNLKKEILRKIEISPEEREAICLHENQETKRIEWDAQKDEPRFFDFSAEEVNYMKESCEKLSDQMLPDEMWNVVEKVYNAIQEQ